MIPELGILSLFLVGLLGGVHCAGMCGGIVGALSLPAPGAAAPWHYHFAYNFGRIATYTLGGALAGAIGSSALLLEGILPVQQALFIVANVMLIALGLHLAGLSRAVLVLERVGRRIWKRLQPYSRRLLPVSSPARAFVLGTLWGFLPCGLTYSVLLTSLSSGSASNGAMLMLAFGLGTLPNLIAVAYFARQAHALLGRKMVRAAFGALIAGFGVLGLMRLDPLDHAHNHGAMAASNGEIAAAGDGGDLTPALPR